MGVDMKLTKADKRILRRALDDARADWQLRMLNAETVSRRDPMIEDTTAALRNAQRRKRQIAALDVAMAKIELS